MATYNVNDLPVLGAIESSLRWGAQFGMIADADLATSEAAVLAAIDTRVAKMDQQYLPQKLALKEAVKMGFKLIGSTLMTGGSLAAIYAEIPMTWGVGFQVTG